jgi:hypothetical protein
MHFVWIFLRLVEKNLPEFQSINWVSRHLSQIHSVELESKRTSLVGLITPNPHSALTLPKAVQQVQIDFTARLTERQHFCEPILPL